MQRSETISEDNVMNEKIKVLKIFPEANEYFYKHNNRNYILSDLSSDCMILGSASDTENARIDAYKQMLVNLEGKLTQ